MICLIRVWFNDIRHKTKSQNDQEKLNNEEKVRTMVQNAITEYGPELVKRVLDALSGQDDTPLENI